MFRDRIKLKINDLGITNHFYCIFRNFINQHGVHGPEMSWNVLEFWQCPEMSWNVQDFSVFLEIVLNCPEILLFTYFSNFSEENIGFNLLASETIIVYF